MDVVIASAVLHFARDEAQWHAMVSGAWRVLAPGGMLFCRLASSIGMEDRVQPLGGRRFRLPDGSDRFLVDEAMLVSGHGRSRRHAPRSDQDDGRVWSAVHDDVGCSQAGVKPYRSRMRASQ